MAFDYCTTAEAFTYGNSAGNATDPVNERAAMAFIVTAVSRAIDNRCQQSFSTTTYVDHRLNGTIDRDGVLSVHPPAPILSTPSAASWRFGAATTWNPLTLTDVDVVENSHGAVVRFLGNDLLDWRFGRISVRMSYVGGYADRAAMPADLKLAAQAASWYEYTRRSAPQDKTAIPEMGVVITPGQWPANILRILDDYMKMVRA